MDLFSGSGALGIEALSRGVAYATFVDSNPKAVHQIKHQLALWKIDNAEVLSAAIPHCPLSLSAKTYNLVFLDPPFQQNLIAKTSAWLDIQTWLAPNTLIYVEAERSLWPLPVPAHWQVLKHKEAGEVGYALLMRSIMLPHLKKI